MPLPSKLQKKPAAAVTTATAAPANGDNGAKPIKKAPINRISDSLKPLVVDIHTLVPDPMNARLHPERNMQAIQESLSLYGQLKPIVVRRADRVVVAGNGTLEAAKALGWTKIAANIVEMDAVSAAGYGLADNRTAELARWDNEIVARLDQLLEDAEHPQVGWTLEELTALRTIDWTPPPAPIQPPIQDPNTRESSIKVTQVQRELFNSVCVGVREQGEETARMSDGEVLEFLCSLWLQEQEAAAPTPPAKKK